jgi:hypothetical protein
MRAVAIFDALINRLGYFNRPILSAYYFSRLPAQNPSPSSAFFEKIFCGIRRLLRLRLAMMKTRVPTKRGETQQPKTNQSPALPK